ncbi:Bifunctional apolipoprotein N-acyltransferase/polyprenol monophosphomannose synthase [Castellaniella caeni]
MAVSVEITIPILNEEATLHAQVHQVRAFVDRHLQDLPPIGIVLADNGSTDATPAIAAQLAQELAGVRYLRLEARGVGRALKASWKSSNADIVGYMDLDLATDLHSLRPALARLLDDQADVVTGSRLARGARVRGRSLLRGFTSRVFNLLLQLYLRVGFTDGMCGFKFLQRRHLPAILDAGAVSDGWFFATEVLVVAEHLGLRVSDLPVQWTDDPNSKVKIVKLTLEYLRAMRALRQRLARHPGSV